MSSTEGARDDRGRAPHGPTTEGAAENIHGPTTERAAEGTAERATWTRAALGEGGALDLLTARFDRHRYAPHAHEEFSIGVCVTGTEIIDYRGGSLELGPGAVVVLAPGEPHTGRPGSDGDGYAYRAMYPSPHLFADGARTVPHFRDAVVDDPQLSAALRAAHTRLSADVDAARPGTGRAVDPWATLAAESRLTELFAVLARRHATAGVRESATAGAAVALAVRDRLADDVLAPPTLTELATDLGLSRYQLLRAFRTAMGMPPYAWLAQYRVTRARGLLESGLRPAAVAGLVGFADQAHLTRWFRRVLGVTPAAYRDSVRAGAARISSARGCRASRTPAGGG
ncbi:AraC family transcriptional regulator [Streptomyces sp. NPDC017941]|uniref:AraC family transcriptional regulator n=1 Tax=Streptomyces sp. NPDC017941 TaxID=3365018 RepID=UPI0037AD9DE5